MPKSLNYMSNREEVIPKILKLTTIYTCTNHKCSNRYLLILAHYTSQTNYRA